MNEVGIQQNHEFSNKKKTWFTRQWQQFWKKKTKREKRWGKWIKSDFLINFNRLEWIKETKYS